MEVQVNFIDKGELSQESLEQKKKFEELYQKQDQERNEQKEKKKFIDENFNDPREKMLFIQKQFNEQYEVLQMTIKKFNKKTGNFDELFDQFKDLKQYFLNSQHALTTYDKYKYKEQLESVENTLYQLKDIIRPRKKFQFTNRERTKKSVQQEQKVEKENKTDYSEKIPGFMNLQNQNLTPLPSDLQSTWKLENLDNCQIKMNTVFDAIYIRNLKKCKISVGPVKSSVFIDMCQDCELEVAGHQIRIHNSTNCQFVIYSTSKSIIEHCTKVIFSPYKYSYPGIEDHFKTAGFQNKPNLWDQVQDFNWLKQEKSPNFELVE